jgi:hypothetical protein
MQRVEIGVAVNAQDDSLVINDEMLLAVLQRRFDNPGEAFGPVVPPRVISRIRSPLRSTRKR